MKDDEFRKFIVSAIAFVEGLSHLAVLAIFFLLKDEYAVDPHELALISMVASAPWFLKIFMAIAIDTFPVNSEYRRPYMMIASFMSCCGYLTLALQDQPPLWSVVATLIVISTGSALCSTASEALLVENLRMNSTGSNSQLTVYFACKAMGSLLVSYSSGAMLDVFSRSTIFLLTGQFPFIIGILAFYLKEPDSRSSENSITMCDRFYNGLFSIKDTTVFWPFIFTLLYTVGPDYDDALTFFLVNELRLSSHFLGTLQLTYGLAAITGLVVYRVLFSQISTNKILLSSVLLVLPFYLLPVVPVLGVNRSWGVPDEAFLLGGGFLSEAISEIQLLPVLELACHICPRTHEATLIALVMSSRSLASSISKFASSLFMSWFGISKNQFGNLVPYMMVCGFLTLLPLTVYYKLPNIKLPKNSSHGDLTGGAQPLGLLLTV